MCETNVFFRKSVSSELSKAYLTFFYRQVEKQATALNKKQGGMGKGISAAVPKRQQHLLNEARSRINLKENRGSLQGNRPPQAVSVKPLRSALNDAVRMKSTNPPTKVAKKEDAASIIKRFPRPPTSRTTMKQSEGNPKTFNCTSPREPQRIDYLEISGLDRRAELMGAKLEKLKYAKPTEEEVQSVEIDRAAILRRALRLLRRCLVGWREVITIEARQKQLMVRFAQNICFCFFCFSSCSCVKV